MKKLILLIFSALAVQSSYAQCDGYHISSQCKLSSKESKGMFLSTQSRSGTLEANITYSFQIVLFGRMDYKIIFCTQDEFYPVHFVITERESGEVYYDNEVDEYVESIGLTTDKTITFIVEVTLLAEGTEFNDFKQNRGCLGMPVMYRRVPKFGF
jgi:hypothetical protein